MATTQDDTIAELQRANAELRRERDAAMALRNSEYGERIAHQSATIDVLKVMAASPGDPQPVFDLIAHRARDVCDAYGLTVYEFDGSLIHWRAATGVSDDPSVREAVETMYPMAPSREWPVGRAIMDGQIIHISDLDSEPGLNSAMRGITAKSSLVIPLMRGDVVTGALALGSRESGGFSDSQVELLKTFADQAVIAVCSAETYRKLSQRTADLQESLEYQTATSDVLQVISHSTFDLRPVLDTLVRTAARLCDADQAAIGRPDGDLWRLAANFGFSPEFEAAQRERGAYPLEPDSPTVAARAVHEQRIVHINDASGVPDYPEIFTGLGRQRTSLGVPLVREGESIGYIVLARQRIEPFTERQIELVRVFANQAVIAIENTRLITEQREALERQTATAEILQVINASPGDLAPVFDAVLERAMRLCEATFGLLLTYDGEYFHVAAHYGVAAAYLEFRENNAAVEPHGGGAAHLLETKRPVQTLDVREGEGYRTGNPISRALVDLAGARTHLGVPLLKDGAVVGAILIYRQEVRAFSDKQVALLESFAAQAVIAMENARLISEQREALEQQTATAEVLQVINASPGKLAPVVDVILEKAHSLCGIAYGSLELYDGDRFVSVAVHGLSDAFANQLRQGYLASDLPATRPLLAGDRFTHIADAADIDFPVFRSAAELEGIRTVLFVPLRRGDLLIGMIASARREVRPFSVKEIALLEGFAAQAVIAMENARLIDEQREALEQQTATAEVLQVINASPGDLSPVFSAVLEKAIRLCESEFGIFNSYDGECFHAVAMQGVGHSLAEYLRAPIRSGPGLALHRIAQGENVVHIADITDDDAYRSGDSGRRAVADLGGARSQLMVALRKDGNLLGAINIFRQQVRPFSDRQIALVQNFAEQAVIAMENARLLTEQREALEQQTATSDVLQVINSSLGDLAPVFDAILEKAHRLCGVTHGGLVLRDGETFRAVATHSYSGAFEEQLRQGYRGADNPISRSLIDGARFVHLPDVAQIDHPMVRVSFELEGVRTGLYVPLRKDDVLLGMISSTRTEIRPFSDKEIALVENFAAQAVIAMENARLLGELRQRTGDLQESLEYQTAISDVLKVISRSTFDLQPVLETLLATAARLCDADGGGISLREGNAYRMAANYNAGTSEYDAFFRNRLMTVDRGTVTGRAVLEARIIHVADVMSDPEFTLPVAQLGGARTVLGVPLLRDGVCGWGYDPYAETDAAFYRQTD